MYDTEDESKRAKWREYKCNERAVKKTAVIAAQAQE